jgi:hypothetical protein
VRRSARSAGMILVVAASLMGCAVRPVSISPSAAAHGREIGGDAASEARAGLVGGGYGPPQPMQQAQQTLLQQGRAGNPNYNIVDARGAYVHAVGDH